MKKASTKKTAKKAAKKVAKKTGGAHRSAPRKVAKKAAKKPPAKKPPAKKTAKKKAAPKKTLKARPKTTRTAKAGKKATKKAPAKKKAAKSPSGKKRIARGVPKFERAVVTTVLPPKLSSPPRKGGYSMRPARAAVKAPKPPQSKHVKGSVEATKRKRLSKAELKYFENLLNDKKETLIQELDYIEDNSMRLNSKDGAGDLSSHAYHLADHATETQDREQAFHLASREGRFLYYIEEALDRVRNGTFGICKKCGTLIPTARLEAVPTAKMCISCKSMQEHAVEGE